MFSIFKKKVFYMERVEFEIKLVHEKPVDLIQMANSLIALDNIAKSHISKEYGVKESRILLNGVKEGCDIYQLALDFGSGVLPMLEGISTVKDILSYIDSYKKIENKTVDEIRKDKHYNVIDAESINKLADPILSGNENTNIQITIMGDNKAPITITQNDAKAISNNADFIKEITSQKEEIIDDKKPFEKVLIKMYQMKDTKRQVQDKAYCDDILHGKPISTIIENEEEKKEMLPHAFTSLFLVDIETVKCDGEIKLYRVTKLHNIIPNDEN